MSKEYLELLVEAIKEMEQYNIAQIKDPVLIEMMEAERKEFFS